MKKETAIMIVVTIMVPILGWLFKEVVRLSTENAVLNTKIDNLKSNFALKYVTLENFNEFKLDLKEDMLKVEDKLNEKTKRKVSERYPVTSSIRKEPQPTVEYLPANSFKINRSTYDPVVQQKQ